MVVALAVPADTPFPQNSGVLVASGEPLRAKAITLSSRKWGARGATRSCCGCRSAGSATTWPLRASDDELLAWALDDLATVFGLAVDPVDARVQRWIDAMPQYGPGHAELVAAGAGRPAAEAGRGRQLPGRHRRAGVHRRPAEDARSRPCKRKWHDRFHGQT